MSGIMKNDYFTYTDGSRNHQQNWTGIFNKRDITVCVQGSIEGWQPTYFGKKHLLTFKGGKMDKSGKAQFDKMSRYYDIRYDGAIGKTEKFGRARLGLDNALTFIDCDKLSAYELREIFVNGLLAAEDNNKGNKAKALIRKNGCQLVGTLYEDYCLEWTDACVVQFQANNAKDRFLIQHMVSGKYENL